MDYETYILISTLLNIIFIISALIHFFNKPEYLKENEIIKEENIKYKKQQEELIKKLKVLNTNYVCKRVYKKSFSKIINSMVDEIIEIIMYKDNEIITVIGKNSNASYKAF